MKHKSLILLTLHLLCFTPGFSNNDVQKHPWLAKDLNPVKHKKASHQERTQLVKAGKSRAAIVVTDRKQGADLLQKHIRSATGVELPITKTMQTPAIVLGDCEETRAMGLDSSKLPIEGFVIVTSPNKVHILGHHHPKADGQLWGAIEFLERFVGVRWFFPAAVPKGEQIGLSIPKQKDLIIPPTHIEDHPAFRKREIWPPWSEPWQGRGVYLGDLHKFLRAGNTWPHQIKVHQPYWDGHKHLVKNHPEVFQLKSNGERYLRALCYGNPKTLDVYLEGIQNFLDKKPPYYTPIADNKTITVCPADLEARCSCRHCKALFDEKAGRLGLRSNMVAKFTDKLAREVLKRWPKEGFTIQLLSYMNWTAPPSLPIKFPGNVEVQVSGLPGIASYADPSIRRNEQRILDGWFAISGRKVQNWHYCVWPATSTHAAYQYPHILKNYYQKNRDKIIGSMVNGDWNHWPRQHISLYCWMKLLWDPDFDVDAAMDTFCARMFGNAAKPMREILRHQTEGWENTPWPGGRYSARTIYERCYPPARIHKMEKLLEQARLSAAGNRLVESRIAYYAGALETFFAESKAVRTKAFTPILVKKAKKEIHIDGRLDESDWSNSTAYAFLKADGKKAKYPTTIKALWNEKGITLGFKLDEPTPERLHVATSDHDSGMLWWDDNVEIFVDVTGQNNGLFHQFIVNADNAIWDSKIKDFSWECHGFKSAVQRGEDHWSMEVFIPFAAFDEIALPNEGRDVVWTGNFTRHRVSDSLSMTETKAKGSTREYQRLNTTGAFMGHGLADFTRIVLTHQ